MAAQPASGGVRSDLHIFDCISKIFAYYRFKILDDVVQCIQIIDQLTDDALN